MKKLLLILLCFPFIGFGAPVFHVGELAEYYISQEGKMITMKVVLEKAEILNLDFKSDCDVKKTTAFCLSNYILENITVEINNRLILFELGDSYTEYGHLVLLLTGKFKDKNVTSINIRNDCFYEFYNGYRNRIILNIGNFKSSYKTLNLIKGWIICFTFNIN